MTFAFELHPLEPRTLMSVDVLTYHNDNALNGLNAAETSLAPSNVNFAQFGKLFSVPLDGNVYAQPLVKTGVNLPGQGVHDVAFLATEHDTVYALDANTGALLWQRSFLNRKARITTVSAADVGTPNLGPEIGITSTPVIDPATGTMYVLAETKEVSSRGKASVIQRLHALDLTTGAEKLGGPIIITATVAGTGSGSSAGAVKYDTLVQNQRPSLTLANGTVYVASASHADLGPYHGWILGYSAATLRQTAVFNVTPNGTEGGVWQSGAGLSADAAGNLYVTSGNGTFDANTGGPDFGDTLTRLTSSLAVSDYFAPFNQASLAARDKDLGSGGVLLLPDSAGSTAHPHLAVFAGKEGRLYLVDRDHLGGFNAKSDAIVQESTTAITAPFGTPAFFNNTLYYAASGDRLKAFPVTNAHVGRATSQSTDTLVYPGATPAISANGTANGIVWTVAAASATDAHAVLRAYDASNVATRLYTSDQAKSRDALGAYNKFQTPTVANGKVYVATKGGFAAFGELPAITATVTAAPALRTAADHYQFVVTYHSNAGSFDDNSFGDGDVIATTSKGYTVAAKLLFAASGKHNSMWTATYRISGPWTAANNGTYTLQLQPGQIGDADGNFAPAAVLGNFTVKIA